MTMTARQERIQRIRIGLTGLAFVFLLVLLGTAVGGSREEAVVETGVVEKKPDEPAEPLAELGAAPGQAAVEQPATPPDPALDGTATDVVVDEIARPLEKE
ncbi:hypothetical protein [Sphingomicrobium nitratireducens]|uniref:hypothetical protein n=1 Tax=Sphingomicrobium nitratireducens TaxID=2964666 RepID=UPI00223EC09B|nr:hypothetical protein [Sphingomicrobium nitratireducens]